MEVEVKSPLFMEIEVSINDFKKAMPNRFQSWVGVKRERHMCEFLNVGYNFPTSLEYVHML